MALTSVWTLVRWLRRITPESRNEAPYIASDPLALVATSFIALTAMIFLVSIVGTYIAIALFLGFYMRVIGKHSWGMTTYSVIGAVIFIYFLFEWQLTKYLPMACRSSRRVLWIDNFRWEYLM